MTGVIAFIAAHPAPSALAVYWLFSAVVSGMPAPVAASGLGYRWAYSTLHALAGDLSGYIKKVT
jgi:hypothetical protein